MSQFSDDFSNTVIGEWVLLNLSDCDSSENETLSTNTASRASSQNDCSLSEKVHCTYECLTCGEKLLDYALPKHHYIEHPNVPFNMKLYVTVEIEKLIRCNLCNNDMVTNDFKTHQSECHVGNWLNLVKTEFEVTSESSSESDNANSGPTEILTRIFKCEACGSLVFEDNLDEHHETIHINIPLNINIYELYEVAKQELCNVCGQWMENRDQHQLNCYIEVERDLSSEIGEGLRNVFMTDQEFERLRDRIDEVDGRFFLRNLK